MANPTLQKIIKLTQAQYNTLDAGGTVGGYTGLNDNYLYLIQSDDTPVLLWQNTNPSSAFAAQTITISNSAAYQYLVIGVKNYMNWTSYNFIKIKNTVGGNAMLYSIETDGTKFIGTKSRKVTITSNTRITFSAAWDTNNNVQNNGVCTPVIIYGTNVL